MTSGTATPCIVAATDPDAITRCTAALRSGLLLGLPTETVYGLAADADNASAVAEIFSAKGRPADHPLIVHVAGFDGGMSAVAHYADHVPPFARQLMAAFWPGPLTLILPRRAGVAAVAAGGQNSVGLRCPAHPLAQDVLNALRHPAGQDTVIWGLAAPSANRFGRVSPTRATHVQSEFAGTLGDQLLILDGGSCAVGIESTIVDCTRGAPVLLRPGDIGAAQIEAACGRALVSQHSLQAAGHAAPRASGTLASHYAPNATVRLMDAAALQQALDLMDAAAQGQGAHGAAVLAVYTRTPMRVRAGSVVERRMPSDAAVAAHELFSVLREFDAAHVKLIWVETPPGDASWDGVRDRLHRAATPA